MFFIFRKGEFSEGTGSLSLLRISITLFFRDVWTFFLGAEPVSSLFWIDKIFSFFVMSLSIGDPDEEVIFFCSEEVLVFFLVLDLLLAVFSGTDFEFSEEIREVSDGCLGIFLLLEFIVFLSDFFNLSFSFLFEDDFFIAIHSLF